MSREELFGLLDDELRQEFMAFAPIDKMLLKHERHRRCPHPARRRRPPKPGGRLARHRPHGRARNVEGADATGFKIDSNTATHDCSEKGGEA